LLLFIWHSITLYDGKLIALGSATAATSPFLLYMARRTSP
jgi:hypothetical protein